VPIISMFYGIIIRMYLIDDLHHNLPHLHAKYAEFEASLGIKDAVPAGSDPALSRIQIESLCLALHCISPSGTFLVLDQPLWTKTKASPKQFSAI